MLVDDLAELGWELLEAIEGGVLVGLFELCFDGGLCSFGDVDDLDTALSCVESELLD